MHIKWVSLITVSATLWFKVTTAAAIVTLLKPENETASLISVLYGVKEFQSSSTPPSCSTQEDCPSYLRCIKEICQCPENTRLRSPRDGKMECYLEGPSKGQMENVVIVVIAAVSVSTFMCILAAIYRRFYRGGPSTGRVYASRVPSRTGSLGSIFIQEIATLDSPPAYDEIFRKDSKFQCFDPPTYLECMQKSAHGFCFCTLNSSSKFQTFDHQATVHSLSGLDNNGFVDIRL